MMDKGNNFMVPVKGYNASNLVGLEGLIYYNKDLLTLKKFEYVTLETNEHKRLRQKK